MTPQTQNIPAKRKQKECDFEAKPFKIDGVYCRLVPLTRGLFAIVDAADYHWLMQWNWQAKSAGKNSPKWYATHRGKLPMHRLILGLSLGEECDHENRVGLDNRRRNLRHCEHRNNVKNASRRKDNTTGYRGVYPHGKKYAALLQVDGRAIYMGVYDTPELAAHAYDKAALFYHGEFANLNFPERIDGKLQRHTDPDKPIPRLSRRRRRD